MLTRVRRLFTEHPGSVGESYLQHMLVALTFASRLFLASVVCLVHAVAPWLFTKTASGAVHELHRSMVTSRDRRAGHDLAEGEPQRG